MTDQRPIDPSTLRDGDVVRAKRGEHGVVEGMFCRLDRGGWCLHDGPKRARETAWSAAGWTITDILRPVLVKGDRVEVAGITGEVFAEPGGFLMVLWPDESTSAVPNVISRATRLPVAPEPAPIEVGDWWKSATGIVGVVLGVDGDTLTWRRLDGSLPLAGRTHVMAESWTRLDGPPEPAVGKVYVLTSFVCENIAGHHYRMGISGCHPWSEFLRCFTRQELATLQIVHTLGVE